MGLFHEQLLALADAATDDDTDAYDSCGCYPLWLIQYLQLLADAPEFAEIPVRHKEHLLNAELAQDALQQVRIQQPSKQRGGAVVTIFDFLRQQRSFESLHTKTLLLLLAHMKGAVLPITDYINDKKSILD